MPQMELISLMRIIYYQNAGTIQINWLLSLTIQSWFYSFLFRPLTWKDYCIVTQAHKENRTDLNWAKVLILDFCCALGLHAPSRFETKRWARTRAPHINDLMWVGRVIPDETIKDIHHSIDLMNWVTGMPKSRAILCTLARLDSGWAKQPMTVWYKIRLANLKCEGARRRSKLNSR